MASNQTVVKINKTTMAQVREIAKANDTTPPKLIDEMLEYYKLGKSLGWKYLGPSKTSLSTSEK